MIDFGLIWWYTICMDSAMWLKSKKLFGIGRLMAIGFCYCTCTSIASALLLGLMAQSARAQWENIRGVAAASCLVESSTGEYRISYTVGEPSASLFQLSGSSSSVLSGYLSQIPSNSLYLSILHYESTGAVVSEGALLGAEAGNSVKFVFSNEISTEVVAAGLEVSEVLNNLGEPVNSTQVVTVARLPDAASVSLTSAASWKKGSIYAVRYSSSVVDINGIALLTETTRYFAVKMDHLKNNVAVAMSDLRARVAVPAGAYPTDFFMIVSTAQTSQAVAAANRKLSALPGVSASALGVLSASAFDEAGGAVQPSSPCVISFPYQDDNGDGIVDGSLPPVRVKNLAVWRLDDKNSLWVKQVGASVDDLAMRVSLKVEHFSSYALMGVPDTDVSTVYAYPVPFRPNAGDLARYGGWADLITFTSLPSYGKLRIYTITGDLVRELDVVPPEMKWDVRNSAGQIVASGVYIWEIVSGKNRKTGKLMVVK